MAFEKRDELVELLSSHADEFAGRRMSGLRLRPRVERIAAVHPGRNGLEGVLRRLKLARGDGKEPVDRNTKALLEPQFLLELVTPEPERGAAFRRDGGLELLDVRGDGV